jgi:hypothetical protein
MILKSILEFGLLSSILPLRQDSRPGFLAFTSDPAPRDWLEKSGQDQAKREMG